MSKQHLAPCSWVVGASYLVPSRIVEVHWRAAALGAQGPLQVDKGCAVLGLDAPVQRSVLTIGGFIDPSKEAQEAARGLKRGQGSDSSYGSKDNMRRLHSWCYQDL
jgi:hypothetical protein